MYILKKYLWGVSITHYYIIVYIIMTTINIYKYKLLSATYGIKKKNIDVTPIINNIIDNKINILKVNNKTADEYFYSRPIESQIGAWASIQSNNLKNRLELENRFKDYEIKFKYKKVIRPTHWSGYIVVPNLKLVLRLLPHFDCGG